MSEVNNKGFAAKQASYALINCTTEEKNAALSLIAEQISADQAAIVNENQKDLVEGKANGLSDAVLDRIMLNENRIQGMVQAVHLLVELKDPIGEILETINKENGLRIETKR